MLALAVDGLVSTTAAPLRAVVVMGSVISAVSALYGIYIILAWFISGKAIIGWSSLITCVLFLGGMNLATLGVIGLYIGKVFDEVKGRPQYIIQSMTGAR